jgi:hypothetical protein
MIDVGEPRSLAGDEVLFEVRAAGVGNWDEFVRTGGWDVGAKPPMALGVEAAGRLCHGNANEPALPALRAKLAKRHAAATAPCHCAVASARKIRSVDREMRWRCRLKVLWTAACMLRKRWADRADLKRCCLRSRRRTA